MKIRNLLITLLFLLNFFQARSQAPDWEWAKNAGEKYHDTGNAIITDSIGNSYVTGYFTDTILFGNITLHSHGTANDIFLIKYDASGNVLWANNTGGRLADQAYGIDCDIFGNIYVTGASGSDTVFFGNDTIISNSVLGNVLILKYDSLGNPIWARGFPGGGYANGISVDTLGNAFITGHYTADSIIFGGITLINRGNQDVFIVKYDSSGGVSWANSAGLFSYDYGTGINTDIMGNCIVTGYFFSDSIMFGGIKLVNPGGVNIFTTKYDTYGNVIWAKCAGGLSGFSGVFGSAVISDIQGNNYVAGNLSGTGIQFGSYTLSTSGYGDIIVVKYNPSGNVVWAKKVGGISDEQVIGISIDANSNIYVTGYYYGPFIFAGTTILNNGMRDIFVLKFDSLGNEIWGKGAGGATEDWGMGISNDAIGNTYITGQFRSPDINFGGIYFVNADTSGTISDIFVTKIGNVTSGNFEYTSNIAVNVFPNPISDELNIIINNNLPSEIILYDIASRKLLEQKFSSSATVNTTQLAKGIYIYEIRSNKGLYKSGKLVKD